MMAWLLEGFVRMRVRQLRKAKLIRRERFVLAFDRGDMKAATKHRIKLGWYLRRIAALTGEPESVSTPP
jgi:hypothetical protein